MSIILIGIEIKQTLSTLFLDNLRLKHSIFGQKLKCVFIAFFWHIHTHKVLIRGFLLGQTKNLLALINKMSYIFNTIILELPNDVATPRYMTYHLKSYDMSFSI